MTSPDRFAGVRYIVDDVQAAVDFYTTHLGFTLRAGAAPDPAGNLIELFQPA
ncbi:VOC family protein [Microbispora triticiradicis]|uniref:VOC family protein n=2 Tax=Microbispora TaxID=2005 RepID=A0ABY3LV54_9ACTN|nr:MULTISPECIES: VOC family protein [Microbispora]TLP60577.1 VOC family protein [Microbispora fusca]TYB54865.1 VOC family protein [Microbispora tritici]